MLLFLFIGCSKQQEPEAVYCPQVNLSCPEIPKPAECPMVFCDEGGSDIVRLTSIKVELEKEIAAVEFELEVLSSPRGNELYNAKYKQKERLESAKRELQYLINDIDLSIKK